jgi:predicted patatin/cPLA2 family phospholipase
MSDFVLVIQGGGSRGSYAAGVIDTLMERGYWASEVYGTSAGALIGCNYLSKDVGRCVKMIYEMPKNKRFIRPLNYFNKGSIFDFRFLLEDLPKKELPFNFEEFKKNPCKYSVVATNCRTGLAAYFSKDDPDFWKALGASASLPLVSKPVFVDEVPYLDGGTSCPIAFEKPLSEGNKKIVVIATRAKGYRKRSLSKIEYGIAEHLYKSYPRWLEAYKKNIETYNALMDKMDRLSDQGRIFVFYPSVPPKIGHAEKRKKKLEKIVNLGIKDALFSLPALKAYLSK